MITELTDVHSNEVFLLVDDIAGAFNSLGEGSVSDGVILAINDVIERRFKTSLHIERRDDSGRFEAVY